MTHSILLIEPDIQLLDQYERKFVTQYDVHSVLNAQSAVDVLDDPSKQVDLIVMDIALDANNGIEFIHELRSYDDWIDIPVVILSSTPKGAITSGGIERYGIKKFLYKPHYTPGQIMIQLGRALHP